MFYNLVNLQKLNFEKKSRVRRNDGRMTSGTITVVGSNGQKSLFTEGKLGNTFVPTSDDLTNTNGGAEGLTTITRRVKLLAIGKSSNVVHGDTVTALRE